MRPIFLAAALALVAAGAHGAGNGEPRQGTQAPELGAGPHQDFQPMEGGNGERLRPGFPEPQVPTPKNPDAVKPAPPGASAGSSARPSDQQDREDERRATERKEKAKQRPGFKEEAPSPRAAIPSTRAPNRVN
jgi:hypothetical protein